MKLWMWIALAIVITAVVTSYASKHYTLNKLANATGVPKQTLADAAAAPAPKQ
jgi:hypothetical protein